MAWGLACLPVESWRGGVGTGGRYSRLIPPPIKPPHQCMKYIEAGEECRISISIYGDIPVHEIYLEDTRQIDSCGMAISKRKDRVAYLYAAEQADQYCFTKAFQTRQCDDEHRLAWGG